MLHSSFKSDSVSFEAKLYARLIGSGSGLSLEMVSPLDVAGSLLLVGIPWIPDAQNTVEKAKRPINVALDYRLQIKNKTLERSLVKLKNCEMNSDIYLE